MQQGQYNLRNPAVKRLMREAQELSEPTEQFYAQPLEDNLFEWHFTIRGPGDSDFDGGIYHGRIVLPPEYPMKPPSIILLTPNGRFETFKKICLSISGHHPESWQPSWSIRTAMLAIIGFMPSHGNGAIGSLDYTPEERKVLARKSNDWKCSECGAIKCILKPVTDASEKDTAEAKELASQINFQGENEKKSSTSSSSTNAETTVAPPVGSPTTPPVFPPSPFFNQQMFERFAAQFSPNSNHQNVPVEGTPAAMQWPPAGFMFPGMNMNFDPANPNTTSHTNMMSSWQEMMTSWQQHMNDNMSSATEGASSSAGNQNESTTQLSPPPSSSSSSYTSGDQETSKDISTTPTPDAKSDQGVMRSADSAPQTLTSNQNTSESPGETSANQLRQRVTSQNNTPSRDANRQSRPQEDVLPAQLSGGNARDRDNPYLLLVMALLSFSIALLLLRRLFNTVQEQYNL